MTNSIRYQFDNQLDSASLELNQIAAIISYEEYHPFGTTSYRSGRTETEVSQKYPHYTPYQYAGNKPVSYIDLDGLEEEKPENIDNTSSNGSPNGMETRKGINQLKINIDGSTEEIEDSNFYYYKRGKDDPYGKMSVFVFTDGGEAEKF